MGKAVTYWSDPPDLTTAFTLAFMVLVTALITYVYWPRKTEPEQRDELNDLIRDLWVGWSLVRPDPTVADLKVLGKRAAKIKQLCDQLATRPGQH